MYRDRERARARGPFGECDAEIEASAFLLLACSGTAEIRRRCNNLSKEISEYRAKWLRISAQRASNSKDEGGTHVSGMGSLMTFVMRNMKLRNSRKRSVPVLSSSTLLM